MTTTTICRDRHTTLALAIGLYFSNTDDIANIVKTVNIANTGNANNRHTLTL